MYYSKVEIHLGRLQENFRQLKAFFPRQTLAPVIKTDAYGHGILPCAHALEAAGATHLCVYSIDEAAQLRADGVKARIFTLGGVLFPEEIPAATELENTTISVWRCETIRALSEYASVRHKCLEVHLKIDTGMSRLGFFPAEVPEVVKWMTSLSGVKLKGAFTHLASADVPESEHCFVQYERFKQAIAALPADATEIHIDASPGLMRGVGLEFPYARPGIITYGYGHSQFHPELRLQPVMEYKSRLASIKLVSAGETVSYGGRYAIVDQPQRLGVVPVGYGYGYDRRFGELGAPVLVHGKRVPIRGRVCMGMFMVDLTQVPEARIGDEVVLLGYQGDECIGVEELTNLLHTTQHEPLCNIGKEPNRIYLEN
ncbi:MAG: alanine racemase [Victivallales bacterium]|nr:alanine racemase [Victivallales bacterium]